jgi:SAM-dependent methyltransferase
MSNSVQSYYDQLDVGEWLRLDTALGRIELETTLALINRYFPASGCVCDIGAGPGRYSIELLRRGYDVTLFELSPVLLERAKREIAKVGLEAQAIILGRAPNLSDLPSSAFDAALVMGPQYHLVEESNRHKTLLELRRILKPNAIAIVAYLNTLGIIRAAITHFPERLNDVSVLRKMLKSSKYGVDLEGFTESYWATPGSAISEIQNAGFELITYASPESFLAGMGKALEEIKQNYPSAYENIVSVAVETAEYPEFRDTGEHIHFVARLNT